MARAHYAENVVGTSGGGSLSLLTGATVHVYDQGTTDHIAQTIYDSDAGVGTLSNPLTSDANGKIEFWLDDPARVDLAISKVGFTSQTRTVDVEAAASGGGSGPIWSDPVTVTDAQMLALDTAHVDIVPAPTDPNELRLPLLVFIQQVGDGDGYIEASPTTYVTVGWGGVSGNEPGAGIVASQALVTLIAAANAYIFLPLGAGMTGAASSVHAFRQAITPGVSPGPGLAISFGASDTVGVTPDATRSLVVWTLYQRITLPS